MEAFDFYNIEDVSRETFFNEDGNEIKFYKGFFEKIGDFCEKYLNKLSDFFENNVYDKTAWELIFSILKISIISFFLIICFSVLIFPAIIVFFIYIVGYLINEIINFFIHEMKNNMKDLYFYKERYKDEKYKFVLYFLTDKFNKKRLI